MLHLKKVQHSGRAIRHSLFSSVLRTSRKKAGLATTPSPGEEV